MLGSVVQALVADRTMSAALAGCADADQVVPARQRLLAEIATTTLQRPSDPRAQLLVTPRSFTPVAGAVEALVADVEASGWATWQPLTDLLATPAADLVLVRPRGPGQDGARRAARRPRRRRWRRCSPRSTTSPRPC